MDNKRQEELRIAWIQYDIKWHNAAQNLVYLTEKISDIQGQVDLIVLPEMFNTGFTIDVETQAETIDGQTIQWMKSISSNTGIAMAGSISLTENGKYFNSFLFIHNGEIIHRYDKKHLFGYGGECEHYTHGNSNEILEWKGWKIAMLVCYDVRFPLWCRIGAESDLMLFVASFPTTRAYAWRQLLIARAIENQCYVLGVNRTGKDGKGIHYDGNSILISPLGEKIIQCGNAQQEHLISISRNTVKSVRRKYPFLKDADEFKTEE